MSLSTASAGTPSAEWNAIVLGDIDVFIHVPDVDVHENEVRLEDRAILRVVEVDVEHLAVAAPVSAEIEDYALVGC